MKKPACACASSAKKRFLTVKSKSPGLIRQEFEYTIPVGEAETMLATLCADRVLQKQRFIVPVEDLEWTIDVFNGPLAGLVLAEVELYATDMAIDLPSWVSQEVTDDPRFRNEQLAQSPAPPSI